MVNEPNGQPPIRLADGGEEFYDYDYGVEENDEEFVEHYPDPYGADGPEPYQEGYLPEYEPDPHHPAGLDAEPRPSWGFEQDSARPRGPPCENCGEYTRADSFGWSPDMGETVDWAICDDCGLAWGPQTGWVDLDESNTP